LFNGQPSTLASWIEALEIRAGSRVLHIGAGLGYYTAILAHIVGVDGRVVAFEVDADLARRARENLHAIDWVDLRHGDATVVGERFDAILLNAGVTHPLDAWLDALAPGGRLMLPLTVATPTGGPLGKGFVLLVTNDGDAQSMSARPLPAIVMIYSAH